MIVPTLDLASSLFRFFYFFIIVTVVDETFRDSFFRLTLKRIAIVLLFLLLIPLLMIWNHIGFALDDILFRGWRNENVRMPLFIVGNARSGTTWLHRLITADESTFTTMRTWEILFAASVTWREFFFSLYDIDRSLFRGTAFAFVEVAEKFSLAFIYKNFNEFVKQRQSSEIQKRSGTSLHAVGLMEAEEDEWIMMHVFFSQLIMLIFPLGGKVLNPLVFFDSKGNEESAGLSSEVRRAIMQRYYRDCVKRHMYSRRRRLEGRAAAAVVRNKKESSDNLIFVSKNPAFTMRLDSLYAAFPDCRVAVIVRDPAKSVPSMISYISQVWHIFASPTIQYPRLSDLVTFCQRHYDYPLEFFSAQERQFIWKDVSTPGRKKTRRDCAVKSNESAEDSCPPSLSPPLKLDSSQWVFVSYSELYENVVPEMHKILVKFGYMSSKSSLDGMKLSGTSSRYSRFFTVLREQVEREKDNFKDFGGRFLSSHEHSVETCCGVSDDEFRQLFTNVYKTHNGFF